MSCEPNNQLNGCTTSVTEGEVARIKLIKAPIPEEFVTDRSKAVVLTWFSVACFGVRVSVMFHLTFVHCTFSSVLVAEWPNFGKKVRTRLAICTYCILSICILFISHFGLRASAITMPELVEIKLVSDDDNSLTDRI